MPSVKTFIGSSNWKVQDGIASACLDFRAQKYLQDWVPCSSYLAFSFSIAAFSDGYPPPLARWQWVAQLQSHATVEILVKDWISLDYLGSWFLFWTNHDGQGEWSMLIGQALMMVTPGSERQGQIHSPEPHEWAIEGSGDSPRKNGHCYPPK